jgi:hypothetical protein
VLVNPAFGTSAETTLRDVQEAARTIGLQIQILNATTIGEIDAAFATLARGRPDALFERETGTIPIVFVAVSDPVGEGFIAGLPRPGGNLTGFISQEAAIAGKWLELLTEIAPGVKRAAIMFNPDTAPGGGSYFLPAFEAAARSLKVAPIAAPVHSDAEIETVITSLGREPGGGLVVADSFTPYPPAATSALADDKATDRLRLKPARRRWLQPCSFFAVSAILRPW